MQAKPTITYREWLQREFDTRNRRRPGYSLRAFSRDIGMPAPKLSQAIRGVCGISATRAKKIAAKLKFSKEETNLFVSMVEAEHSRSVIGKRKARERLARLNASDGFGELSLERFRIMSDWYHFAILELSDVADFNPAPTAIAARLGITTEQVDRAIQRLLDFGLLVEDSSRGYRQTHQDLATPSGIPSREIREHHSQILRRAESALEAVPLEQRDFSAVTMAIDSEMLPEARQWLREFRRKFCRDLQSSPQKDRVYTLSIQFFPLDNERTKK